MLLFMFIVLISGCLYLRHKEGIIVELCPMWQSDGYTISNRAILERRTHSGTGDTDMDSQFFVWMIILFLILKSQTTWKIATCSLFVF